MDAATLAAVMGNVIPRAKYDQYVGPFNNAMIAARCTNVNRAAMWCAQLGHESVGLKYMQEIASGSAYNGRRDLGNIYPGDGPRYKGRGPIQLTGRHNYGAFSRWCHSQGLVDSPDYFVQRPLLVAEPRWGLLAASWYWTVARPKLNAQADAGDIVGATRSINGGTNGLADRSARWKRALNFGTRLLPTDLEEDELSASYEKDSRARWPKDDQLEKDLRGDLNSKRIQMDRIEAALVELTKRVEALAAKHEEKAP